MTNIKVKIKEGAFPVRYKGERFLVGQELTIDEKHFNDKNMEFIEKIEMIPEGSLFEGKTLEELKAYAAEHNIDIGKASTEEGIIKKIEEAQKQTTESE